MSILHHQSRTTSLIIYAYRFYTSPLDEQNLVQLPGTPWLEALSDVSKYQMAVTAHVQERLAAS